MELKGRKCHIQQHHQKYVTFYSYDPYIMLPAKCHIKFPEDWQGEFSQKIPKLTVSETEKITPQRADKPRGHEAIDQNITNYVVVSSDTTNLQVNAIDTPSLSFIPK